MKQNKQTETMTKEELLEQLEEAAEENCMELGTLDNEELVRLWLEWNGIVGYHYEILEVVKAAFGLSDEQLPLY